MLLKVRVKVIFVKEDFVNVFYDILILVSNWWLLRFFLYGYY